MRLCRLPIGALLCVAKQFFVSVSEKGLESVSPKNEIENEYHFVESHKISFNNHTCVLGPITFNFVMFITLRLADLHQFL